MTIPTGTALSQLQGKWSNPYGSELDLQVSETGTLIGMYQSTAGSAGKYYAFGRIDPTLPAVVANEAGQPLSLLINWRSVDPKSDPDPSWNYVSGMSGQIIINDAGNKTLQLNHALIASEAFGETILPGAYVDRLQYLPSTDATNATANADMPDVPQADGAVLTKWTTPQDPDLEISFAYPLVSEAFIAEFKQGTGVSSPMIGTGNLSYVAKPDSYLSISFCAAFTDPATNLPTAVSYAGWIDVDTQTMKLQEYYSTGRSWALRFFQSRGRTLYFTPS